MKSVFWTEKFPTENTEKKNSVYSVKNSVSSVGNPMMAVSQKIPLPNIIGQ